MSLKERDLASAYDEVIEGFRGRLDEVGSFLESLRALQSRYDDYRSDVLRGINSATCKRDLLWEDQHEEPRKGGSKRTWWRESKRLIGLLEVINELSDFLEGSSRRAREDLAWMACCGEFEETAAPVLISGVRFYR